MIAKRAGRSWRIVCSGSSFRGLNSAPLTVLGIAVQGGGFVPASLSELPPAPTLPEFGQIDFDPTGPGRTLRGADSALARARRQ